MKAPDENSLSPHALLPAGACVAAGFIVLILLSLGAFESFSSRANQVQVALLFLITAIGAILAYLLGVIATCLKTEE